MIIRYIFDRLPVVLLLLSSSLLNVRAEGFDCHQTLEGSDYDFTSIGEQQLNRTRETPPTKTVDSLTFNLCDDLKKKDNLDEHDQCPSGTRACLTQVNVKGDNPERVVSVIPLARTDKLDPKLTLVSKSPFTLTLLLHGSDYPEQETDTTPSVPQLLNVTLLCNREVSTPKLELGRYDGSRLDIAYTGAAACPLSKDGEDDKDDKPADDDKDVEPVGNGIGLFFLVILLAFIAYFGIGAYHNYSTYGARGKDLIPHRDFWQEVPYMLKDVVTHLCASRPRRSSRSGYIQV